MRSLLLLSAITATLSLAAPAMAQTAGVMIESRPGAVAATRSISAQATISAIDAQTRLIGLKAADGKTLSVVAGPEVKNFERLRVGDTVTLDYAESLTLELKKASTEEISRMDEDGALAAEPGATPGGVAGRRITVIAEVVALDAAAQTVSLKGPNRTIELGIDDPAQFSLIALGDRVKATYIEAVAVAVEPAPKAD